MTVHPFHFLYIIRQQIDLFFLASEDFASDSMYEPHDSFVCHLENI